VQKLVKAAEASVVVLKASPMGGALALFAVEHWLCMFNNAIAARVAARLTATWTKQASACGEGRIDGSRDGRMDVSIMTR
jgi:hypothetical protein